MQVSHVFNTPQTSTRWKMGALAGLVLTPKTAGGLSSLRCTQAGPTDTWLQHIPPETQVSCPLV